MMGAAQARATLAAALVAGTLGGSLAGGGVALLVPGGITAGAVALTGALLAGLTLLAALMMGEMEAPGLSDPRRRAIGAAECSIAAMFGAAPVLLVFSPGPGTAVCLLAGGILATLLAARFATLAARRVTRLGRPELQGVPVALVRTGGSAPPELPVGRQRVTLDLDAGVLDDAAIAEAIAAEARADRLQHVLLLLPEGSEGRVLRLLDRLSPYDLPVWYCPGQDSAGHPRLFCLRGPLRSRARSALKRGLDLVIGAILLAMVLPALLAVALVIRLESRGPVFFLQTRLGRNQVPFRMIKFRSMYAHTSDAAANRLTTRGDPRITRVGAFLRRTSIDELPQLLNVILGHMSIVGPRPLPLGFHFQGQPFDALIPAYALRSRVQPGITGLAQLRGLRGTPDTLEQALVMIGSRVEQDNLYIDRWSIWLDLRILIMTVVSGAFMSGAY